LPSIHCAFLFSSAIFHRVCIVMSIQPGGGRGHGTVEEGTHILVGSTCLLLNHTHLLLAQWKHGARCILQVK
jgi:hypothetical protein